MEAPNLAIDSADFGLDIIPAIEKSFGFKFEQADFTNVRTYGELCALVRSKLPEAAATDCTSQQAFYKLRQALLSHTVEQKISPATTLAEILPAQREQRQLAAAAIEQHLGMKLSLLDMPLAVEAVGIALLLLSFCFSLIGGFLLGVSGVLIGLAGIAVAIFVFDLGARFGSTLRYSTVRDVVLAMSSTYYRQSRRDPSTVNPRELTDCLNYLFVDMAGVKLAELTPDALL
jgi:hypothetical protein